MATRSMARAPLVSPGVHLFLRRRAEEIGGLFLLFVALLLLLALASYDSADPSLNHATAAAPSNLMGGAGALAADVLLQALGLAAVLLPLVVGIWGWRVFTHHPVQRLWLRLTVLPLTVLLFAAALAAVPPPSAWPVQAGLGGAAGTMALTLAIRLFAPALGGATLPALGFGLALVAALGLLYALTLTLREWRQLGNGIRSFSAVSADYTTAALQRLATHLRERGMRAPARPDARRRPAMEEGAALRARTSHERRRARMEPRLLEGGEEDHAGPEIESLQPIRPHDGARPTGGERGRLAAEFDDDAGPQDGPYGGPPWDEDDAAPVTGRRGTLPADLIAPKAPEPAPGKRAQAERQPTLELVPNSDYRMPPLELLALPAEGSRRASAVNEEALAQNARLLESVLEDFGVRGQVVKVRPGPVVTLYELEPAPGTKSSRVIGLADDIARSMSAISARVAVISGRNAIGIELPNAKREIVLLRELLGSETYEATAGKLALALGKDIGGAPVIADLSRMPHLLVAGTTGSGKSVAINTMILSLLYRLTPEQCKFIMIDPKMLELSVYDGIPHLLSPVVTDPRKAVVALKWTVREMENRYRAMSKLGVRNIAGYNARLAEARRRNEALTRRVQTGFNTETGEPMFEEQALDLNDLPYIVVIVDEMADLMLVAGKDIEAAVQRLAQMARAAGIHIIMATQRPSVDVITGTIKANFPTRISFQVTSKIDSRTILGEQGAEQLLGQGDMLHMAGGGRITRVHGPFVNDDEVEQIVAFLKAQGEPDYVEAVTEDEEVAAGIPGFEAGGGETAGEANLYDQAVALVAREGKASTSFIQRHLQIGYNRAARLIERMETEGVVGPANHVGRREVLVGGGERYRD